MTVARAFSHGWQVAFSRRWLQVFAAAMFINTSYGTLSYAFSVLVTGSGPGGTFGPRTVSFAFGAALLISGAMGIFAGAIADLNGTRRLMAAGSAVGAAGLALLAATQTGWQFFLVMSLLCGPAMAATFYEPVYVLMNRWFAASERPRAYGVLTLLGGFSITIYTPLTRWLVSSLGWREAVIVLGVILLAVGLVVTALLREPFERPAEGDRLTPSRFLREARSGLHHADRRFWWFTLAFVVATVAISGFSFHMIAQLESRGFAEAPVANAIALTGIISLPARLLLPMASGRVPSVILLAVCMVLLGTAAALASVSGSWWQVWLYIAVYGAVFGAVYPLRALVTSEQFAGPYFGRIIGLQALFVAAARALGPVAVSAVGASAAAYETAFRLCAVALIVAAAATWWSMRGVRTPRP